MPSFGDGSDGALSVGSGTTNLLLNRKYQYTTVNIAAGAILSTSSTAGSVLYITATTSITINGTIDVSGKLNPGLLNTSVVIDGTTYNTPSVSGGGSGDYYSGSSAPQSLGFGGGGQGGYAYVYGTSSLTVGGRGGTGGATFGAAGTSTSVTVSPGAQNVSGGNGGTSAGGGGAAGAYNSATTTFSGNSGAGGSSYGANGANGGNNGSFTGGGSFSWITAGGGGAGGIAGRPGVHVVLTAPTIIINGTIITKGGNGGNGGNGGASYSNNGLYNYGWGGGGGGGGYGGNVYINYNQSLTDAGTYTMVGGLGGNGGTGGASLSYTAPGGAIGGSGTKSVTLLPREFTQTATASIKKTFTKTQTSIARIGAANTQIQTAKARIAQKPTKTQTTKARLSISSNITQTTLARITTIRTLTQPVNATIRRTISKTQPATAALVDSAEILKRYDYKVYEGSNYLGLLPDVTSEYGVAHEINTVGSQVTVTVSQSPDVSGYAAYQNIMDESGNNLLDENGVAIQSEGYPGIIGVEGGATNLIRTGNRVQIIEYSSYYPNGKTMFNGRMIRWDARIGDTDDIVITLQSTGADFDEYMVTIGDTLVATQTSSVGTTGTSTYGGGMWQAIKPTGSAISVGKLKIDMAASVATPIYTTAVLCSGNPANDSFGVVAGASSWTLGSGNVILGSSSAVGVSTSFVKTYTFTLPQNYTLAAGGSYYVAFVQTIDKAGSPGSLLFKTAASGTTPAAPFDKLYRVIADTNNVTYTPAYNSSFPILRMELDTIGGNSYVHNVDMDPVAGLMPLVMDNYIAQGGGLNYLGSGASFPSSGLSLTFDLKMNTAYEALETSRGLAPSSFYYYVDLGTDTIYEKAYSSTADIILTRAKNVKSVTFSASIENVKNSIHFSGGKPSGSTTNLYKVYTDSTSIGRYGQRLLKKSDNRVILSTTADAIGSSTLGSLKNEQYLTTVDVLDTMMDITLLKPGMMVGFNGYNSFYDFLLLPVVRVDYTPHVATLVLGSLPPRVLPTYEKVLRELQAEQTIDNPDTPS